MADFTKVDFVLTGFASVAAIEAAAQSMVSTDGKLSANIGRAAWGLAVITAVQQPEMSVANIIADVALAMGLATGKGERHQPLSSRLRSALSYVRSDASPVRLPVATGADTEATVIAQAERFIGRHNVTAMAAAGSAGRADKVKAASEARDAEKVKAEKATLALAGVTAKVPYSMTAILDAENTAMLRAAARAGDGDAIKALETIIRAFQADVVAGIVVNDDKAAAKAKKAKARTPKVVALAA